LARTVVSVTYHY